MRFGVLGPLMVWTTEGRPVRVPEVKVRALLADLLVHEGRPVSADRIVDDLWGENPPGNPANTLQTKVSQLRGALGDRDLVVYQPSGYALVIDEVDALQFTDLVASARATNDPFAKADLLSDALALWRGPAYADFRDEGFVTGAAVRLEEQWLTALEDRAEVRLVLGEHSRLADELGEAVSQHPLRERLRAAHLRALYRSGRQSEALAGYADLRERLADELGLDPGPDLVALHQAMLEQDPTLAPIPAPATSAARLRSNLPAPLTRLIGREESVTEVRALLSSARLVTVTGPGGVGKTRLALAAARLPDDLAATDQTPARPDFPDGVWLAELAGTSGGVATVAEVVAAALGIRDDTVTGSQPGVPPADLAHRLAEALSGQQLLLMLDNCEHLVEPVSELVDLLLKMAPALRVLATSQVSLAIPGESLYELAPLDLPEPSADLRATGQSAAVRLFVARAAAAAPGFVLDEQSAPWVTAICSRLDGLPLALELAAARVRALGVRGVAERLDDRFQLLTPSGRGRPARQQTMRAVVDWSWGQLTEPQRVALCALAVHPGGCTLEAAQAVGVDVDVLDQLVNRSVVVAEPLRYRLLESIAAFCLEQLADDDRLFRRRDVYYTDLAERAEPHLYGHTQRQWLDRLDAEAPNLRAALEHTTDKALALRLVNALAWYRYLRGKHREGHSSLARAMALPGVESPRTAAWEAGFAMLIGDGTDLLERSRTALHRLDDHEARSRWFLAHVHLSFGDVAAAEGMLDAALATFRAVDDHWGQAAALASRTKLAMFQGDLARAERFGTESLALFGELGDRWGQLQASDMLGYRAEVTGDYDQAARLHREGLRVAEELRLWTDVSYRLSSLGRIALLTGDLARSREFHERGMRLAAEQSNGFAYEFARVGLGLVARRTGDLDAAEVRFRESLDWNRKLKADNGVPFYGVTLLLAELGFIAEQRGDASTARSLHLDGLAAARQVGEPRAIALAQEGLAGVAALTGRYEEAARLLGEADALRESVGAPLPPAERGDVDRITTVVRAALGEEAFAAAFVR